MGQGYNDYFQAVKKGRSSPPQVKRSSSLKPIATKKEKGKKPFPISILVSAAALLAIGLAYLNSPDAIESFAQRIEVKWMGQVSAEEKAEKKSEAGGVSKEKPAAQATGETSEAKDGKPKTVKEDLSYIDKLRSRKEELDLREKELNQLEEELQRQKVEVDARIRKLEQMRRDISSVLKERVESDETQVNKLVDLYSNMKPKQAADVIGSLQEELAVTVLSKMKKKNAAEVMNLLPSEKARNLSERLTGYKR